MGLLNPGSPDVYVEADGSRCFGLRLSEGPKGGMRKLYRGYIGIMEKKMETTRVYWDNIRIMKMNMKTTGLLPHPCRTLRTFGDSRGTVVIPNLSTLIPKPETLVPKT